MTNTDKYYTKEEWALYMREWRKKNKDKTKKYNQKPSAKVARKKHKKEYYKNNKEKCRKATAQARRKRELGMPSDYYDNKHAEQKGRCALCGKHQARLKHALGLDHNHQTMGLRGLLCGTCNTQLGHYEIFLTNKDLVERFNQYLKMYE